MKLTPLQIAALRGLINLYETGSLRGDYANVTRVKGDAGGLTYGRSQTTRASGNLYTLLLQYCGAAGARYADQIRPYLPRFKSRDVSLDTDNALAALLKKAGGDAVMRTAQDTFFDARYLAPALKTAAARNILTALGCCVIYDGTVHGSVGLIIGRAGRAVGYPKPVSEDPERKTERRFIAEYVRQRRAWLAGHSMTILHKTVYRMDVFSSLIAAGNWDLDLPFIARGVTVSEKSLGIEAKGWALTLAGAELGQTWQSEKDAYRNYFPLRPLLEKLYGKSQTMTALVSRPAADGFNWGGKPVRIPVVVRDGQTWVQVRAFAGWVGLQVDRDEEKRTITLSRASK